MAAELVQVRMTKNVDFASRGELVWMEPAMARAIVRTTSWSGSPRRSFGSFAMSING